MLNVFVSACSSISQIVIAGYNLKPRWSRMWLV